MKRFAYLLFGLALTIGCQKVIDVDLNEANENIVIEANYSAEDSTVRVKITMTSSFFDSQASPLVNDATVTITDHLGNPTSVPFIGNGEYELQNYIPIYNTSYNLNVIHSTGSYSADCQMKSVVPLEDITYQFFPGFFGGNGGYAAFMNFYDPVDTVNHYIAVLTQNGTVFDGVTEVFTQDDVLTDGNLVERPLFANDFFQIDDTIGMELRSVDKAIYEYYEQAASIAGDGQASGAPGNPATNWSNDALGYFNCYSSSRKSVIIQ